MYIVICQMYFFIVSYLLGINKLSKELQSSKEERMREKYSSVKLLRKTKAALVKNDSLTK